MRTQGDKFVEDRVASLPAGFKYLIGAAAFFIAGCSAFFRSAVSVCCSSAPPPL